MSAVRRHPRNYNFLGRYSWYVPGIGDMFILFLFILLGAVLGTVVTSLFTLAMGQPSTEFAMLISYPLQFLPAMIYAGYRSGRLGYNHGGFKMDSCHFKPVGTIGCTLMVVVVTLMAGFCTDAASSLLPEMPEWLEEALKSMTTGTVWVNFLCVSIFAPFFEEWLCRGMILRGLLGNGLKPVIAVPVSAAFFAIIHFNPWQAVPAFVIGCLIGYVYYRTGSLKLAMLMHFTNNTFALACSHIPGLEEMDSWMEVLPSAQYWCLFTAGILVMILTILALRRIQLESPQGNCDPVKSLFEE